jgi:glutamine synthetase
MDAAGQQKTLDALVSASIGRPDFTQRFGLDSQDREAQLADIMAKVEAEGIEVIRVSFIDTHGQLRTRPMEVRHFPQAARNGVPFTTALFAMDSSNNIFQPVFSADGGFGRSTMGGAGDMLAIADLSTFRVLPWADHSASVFADLYLTDGEACPFDPRGVMRKACAKLAEQGLVFVGGVEVECHVFKVGDGRLGLEDCTQPARVRAPGHGHSPRPDRARSAGSHRGVRVGSRPVGDHAGSDPGRRGRRRGRADAHGDQTGGAPDGSGRQLHDQARAPQRVFVRLASA